ncbi:MAG: hypothetical protein LIP01_11975 [Tannerellaceae bacterium]|nr:hypothetical protein [Tannerellaceae bacterium]
MKKMNILTYAGIDIDSNAIRLLIQNVDKTLKYPDFKKVAFIRVPIRLGEDVFLNGEISDEKRILLTETMMGFSHLLKAYKVKTYRACATSAMRDARNGQQIVQEIREVTGISVDIITGSEEAGMIYEAGGLDTVMDKNRNYLYVDVGGGSTELILYGDKHKIKSRSFQIGTVRLLTGQVEKEEWEHLKEWLAVVYRNHPPLSIIASGGGNINKVHKLLSKTEGEILNYAETKVLYDVLKKMSFEERVINYKLNPYRADVIVPALRIFITIAKVCKTNEIYVPKLGLVDGIIHHLCVNENKQVK